MPAEPETKRAVVFVDGQNLFYAVKQAFGYSFPNYDVPALARSLCDRQRWALSGIHFYTGIPSPQDDPYWNRFWSAKLAVMGTRGVVTFSRQLRYRNQTVALPDGSSTTVLVGQEKGVESSGSLARRRSMSPSSYPRTRTSRRWPTRCGRSRSPRGAGSRWRRRIRRARRTPTDGV